MARTYGEPWADCAICGFSSPQSALRRHYRLGLLVDARCADAPGAEDLRRWAMRAREPGLSPQQPVSAQGEATLSGSGYGQSLYGQAPYGE